jgi:phage-related minor tail protein
MLGTDKAADAFKEFRLRIADGSKTTADALASIGINVDDVTARMANGTLSAADAFTLVQGALAATEDPVVRMQAGVGLLGTQFEDLGDDTALALTMTNDWAAGTEGAINTLDAKYATFGDAVSAVWRRLTVSVSPFTDKLLELVNDAVPKVLEAFDRFDAAVGPTVEKAGDIIDKVVEFVRGAFGKFSKTVDEDGVKPISYFKEWADKTFPLIQKVIENTLAYIQKFWDTWGDEIMGIVEFVFGTIFTLIDTALKNVLDLVTFVFQVLTGDFEGAGETLKGIAQRTWDMISGIITGALDGVKNYVTSFDWGAIGTAMIEGIKNGMSNAWSGLTGWFQGKLNELTALLPGSEPKDPSSPLRGLGDRGAALIGNFRAGAEAEMVRMQAQFSSNLGGLATAMAAPVTNVTNNVSFQGSSYAPGDALSTVQLLNMHYRTA